MSRPRYSPLRADEYLSYRSLIRAKHFERTRLNGVSEVEDASRLRGAPIGRRGVVVKAISRSHIPPCGRIWAEPVLMVNPKELRSRRPVPSESRRNRPN